MITLVDLLSFVFILSIMLAVGGAIGQSYGIGWGIAVAVVLGFIGRWLWKLRIRLEIKRARGKLARFSDDELRQHLYSRPHTSPNGWTPNYLLMELMARGEDPEEHIDLVLNMLEDESQLIRVFGYGALRTAFPFLINKMRGYNPQESVENCKEKVIVLRKICENATRQDE